MSDAYLTVDFHALKNPVISVQLPGDVKYGTRRTFRFWDKAFECLRANGVTRDKLAVRLGAFNADADSWRLAEFLRLLETLPASSPFGQESR